MKENNIIINQVPIDLFELFLNTGGDIELYDEDKTYLIYIDSKNANEYYKKYFLDIVENLDVSDSMVNHIPVYINSNNQKLISISEVDDLINKNILGKLMSYITKFDFGNGMQEYLLLEFPRSIFNEMIASEQDLKTDIPAGTLSISVDLMYILVNDEKFKDNTFFNFVTDINNGDVKGILQEPDFKEGGEVKILQLY